MQNFSAIIIIQGILLAFTFAVVLFTVFPLFKSSYWIFRIGDFPRLQITFVCLLTLILLPLVFGVTYYVIGLEFILTFCFAYQLTRIIPYTKLHSKQVERSSKSERDSIIKILISNVLIENRNSEKLLKLIKQNDPDVVLLAEINDWWNKQLEPLKEDYASNICHPLDNAYGMNFYTKLENENLKLNFIVEDDIPSVECLFTLDSGKKIKFYGLHPRPPYPAESTSTAERDAELLIIGKKIQKSDYPTIIAGDFNDVAWSATTNLFQKISGLLDSRIGRGFYNSFHAKYWFMRMPLDHVFQSKHFRLVNIKRLEFIGSDHFPILIELSYENDAEYKQADLESSRRDEEERIKKIEEIKDN